MLARVASVSRRIAQAYSPVEISIPVHGASPHADIARAFGPKKTPWIFLSAEGEANTSLGQSPRKMGQKFGQG
jgi:hypothetical protein